MTTECSVHEIIPVNAVRTWPLPGSGETDGRWQALIDISRRDVVVGRLTEAHADACAITHELDSPGPQPQQLWGVWAAQPPRPVLRANPHGDNALLSGEKMWCSGAGLCTHALVTAEAPEGVRLYAVELSHPGVRVVPDTWHGFGMARSSTLTVSFDRVPAEPVGAPGDYLARAGFWHGAIGVAACWLGAAVGVADRLLNDSGSDPLRRAHRGAVDATLYAARSTLHSAAMEIDADPENQQAARIRARRVRAVVEHSASSTLEHVGRALGAGPLSLDGEHARRVADLTVYLRQSHAEYDLADLGELLEQR
ncbi:acyl-CoA dehydrogenase family protein [Nocardia sp. NBC_01327]|uniref:acyl-CoA dehydrogenase family protein n=1 Tax=Nocardia sp. NBC_01327 TaxID=2903593 RepID=UPI002E0D9E55|nr:acyl-CoA/acyl-ACP dehydrogenase [Nocardia sp. NBC_01327]